MFNWKGEIKSPSNPVNNADNLNCTWTIKTDPLRRIALSARTFNVKSGIHCQCNYMIIHDGKKMMRFCGEYFPTLYSNTNKLIIKFYGHPSESTFHLDYQTYFSGKLLFIFNRKQCSYIYIVVVGKNNNFYYGYCHNISRPHAMVPVYFYKELLEIYCA